MTVTHPIILPTTSTIMPYLSALADCLCNELEWNGGAGPLCSCSLVPGFDVSLEYCEGCGDGRCGSAWVRVAGIAPVDTFPIPILDGRPCVRTLAWQVEAGCVRCMPVPEDGTPVDAEGMGEVTLNQMADAEAIYRALLCCDAPQIAVERYQPIGPAGGCVGGFWVAYLGL